MLGKILNNKEKNIELNGDIKIGYEIDNKGKPKKTPVIIPFKDRFLHTLIVGPWGSGKSSQLIQPMINQDLQNKDLGITLIEPKGDLSMDVFMMAKYYNREVIYFNPILPDCPHINIFEGTDKEVINLLLSSFEPILSKKTKEEKALNGFLITMAVEAIKAIYSEKATFIEFNNLINNVDGKGIEIANKLIETNIKGNIQIGKWFLNKFLVNEDKSKYIEIKEIINKIATNKYLGKILSLPENANDTIDFDESIKNGKVLIFNTEHGSTRDLGYYLGQFIINKYSLSALKIEDKKPNICYIDEFQIYKGESIVNLLTLGRSYNVSINLSIQSNRLLEDNKIIMDCILNNTRNKIVLPGISNKDAIYYSKLFTEISDNYFERLDKKSAHKIKTTKESVVTKLLKTALIYRPFGQATYSIINNNEIICPGILQIRYIDKELNDIINNMITEWNSKYLNEK